MRTGYLLALDESSWGKIEKRARCAIRKARKYLTVKPGKLIELKSLHWDPPHLPLKLTRRQQVFTAYYKDIPVSSILIESTGYNLKYSKAGSLKEYNHYNGNSLLIWHIVQTYEDSDFLYLDLGGSGHKGINFFKRQFATKKYLYTPPHGAIRFIKRVYVKIKRLLIKKGLIK